MAVFVIISIGILSTFFYTMLWPQMRGNMVKNTKCTQAICNKDTLQDGRVDCTYYEKDKDGNVVYEEPGLSCPFKG